MKSYCLFILLFSFSIIIQAQSDTKTHSSSSKNEKKVITIKKSTDKDGNEVIEKKILEGDAVKNADLNERGDRVVKIITDSTGDEKKIIIDNEVKIIDGDGKGVSIFSNSGSGYRERTVTIKKNADGTVEIKDKSGEDLGGSMNIRVDSSEAKKPNIGVSLNDELKVTRVMNDGAAEKAGLEEGDILTHFEGTFINDYDHLKELLSKKNVGDKIELTYLRDRKEMKSTITLKGGSTRVYFNR
ncbi:MAG: PDZ domain-containing protein [Saprospiraceae bacterium]